MAPPVAGTRVPKLSSQVPGSVSLYRNQPMEPSPRPMPLPRSVVVVVPIGHGVPVVTTSIGAEGIPIRPGVDALVADDEEAFADAVARLYRCRETWEAVRASARALIEEHYSDRAFEAALRALVEG